MKNKHKNYYKKLANEFIETSILPIRQDNQKILRTKINANAGEGCCEECEQRIGTPTGSKFECWDSGCPCHQEEKTTTEGLREEFINLCKDERNEAVRDVTERCYECGQTIYPQGVADWWLAKLDQALQAERQRMVEKVKHATLCDYPKSQNQEEHERNMEIVDRAEAQAREIILSLLTDKEESKEK